MNVNVGSIEENHGKYDMLLAMIQSDSNSTQVAKVKQNLNGFVNYWVVCDLIHLETWMQSGVYLWIVWSMVEAKFEWFLKKFVEGLWCGRFGKLNVECSKSLICMLNGDATFEWFL